MVIFKVQSGGQPTQGLGLNHDELRTLMDGGTVDVRRDDISGTPAMVLVAASTTESVQARIVAAADLLGGKDDFREQLDAPAT